MELKLLLILLIFLITFAPVLLDNEPSKRPVRRKPQSYKWGGPKTDVYINKMLAESIELLKSLNVPISDSICPEVRLTGSHSCYGRCCPRGSLKRYTEYDYYIEVSGHTLENTEKSLRNTLIHELIHTVPGGLCHTGEWRKWAKYVSESTEYNIKRLDGDNTEEDRRRLVEANFTNI
jgi:hypothetical protein